MTLLGKKQDTLRALICVYILTLGLFACADKHNGVAVDPMPTALGQSKVDVPENHLAIIAAFQISNNSSAEELMISVQTLKHFGAIPLADTPNMINKWTMRAIALQPTITDHYPHFRGRVKGPAYRKHTLSPKATDRFSEVYYASELAHISILTEQVGLELFVTLDDKPVCRLKPSEKPQHCAWTPLYTASHQLVVKNNSTEPASYIVVSN